ncbi:MAG: deoxyribose-phosphate aldolase [Candidatus Delongbacteria bacterium]|jgi:deoxyribose-phosphate aldolase|nr:deoxyribose-phosphate aldolase [Candidatus Delongbacteria bacterium]
METNNIKFIRADIEKQIKIASSKFSSSDNILLKRIFSLNDLTSLNTQDNEEKIRAMVFKVNGLKSVYPDMPDVAAICIYPPFVKTAKNNLSRKHINIAAVSGGFPSSQTYLSVKLAESEIAVNNGADELDIVLSLGKFFSDDYTFCSTEINLIKKAIAPSHLKVILESGLMDNLSDVYNASMLALKAGADFIKTSTGKDKKSADPVSVYVMCQAIKDHYEETGFKAGIKPAGGISTPDDAITYYAVVSHVLGEEWLNNKLFRIGASRLANNLLTVIEGKEVNYF